MANIYLPSLTPAIDMDGNVMPGAKLYFYLTDTSSLAGYFLDGAGTVHGTNPQIADADGRFQPCYLDPALIYRVKLTSSTGSYLAYDADPIPGAPISPAEIDAIVAAATAAAAADAASASASADRATLASAINASYINAAETHVPQGLTQTSVGAITAGTGGTPGTYTDGTWTGGNFTVNPTFTYTIDGSGHLTVFTVTGPGIYIGSSPSVPTPVFGHSLSGAAVALTIQYLEASGVGYWSESSDTFKLEAYHNNSGTPAATTGLGPLYTAAGLDAANAALLVEVAAEVDTLNPINANKYVGVRELPAPAGLTVSAEGTFTLPNGVNSTFQGVLSPDQLADSTAYFLIEAQIVSGSAGTDFAAILRWYNTGGQVGPDIAPTKTATTIAVNMVPPSGALTYQLFLDPPTDTVIRRVIAGIGAPARPISDPWYESLNGRVTQAADPAEISFSPRFDANWDYILNRAVIPVGGSSFGTNFHPNQVKDGDIVWIEWTCPVDPTNFLQVIDVSYTNGPPYAGPSGQVIYLGADRWAAQMSVALGSGQEANGIILTCLNTGSQTYLEQMQMFVGPNAPYLAKVSNTTLKAIEDNQFDPTRPQITLCTDSTGLFPDWTLPLLDPGFLLGEHLGADIDYLNLATPGNTLTESASTCGLLPITVDITGGYISDDTADYPHSLANWDYDPITAFSAQNQNFDGLAVICGVLGRVFSDGTWSGNRPVAGHLFFTPLVPPPFPVEVPNGSALILEVARKRKNSLKLIVLSSVNGTGPQFATIQDYADAVWAANDPALLVGFIGLSPGSGVDYPTGAATLATFVGKPYYSSIFDLNVMSADTVAEAMSVTGWNWATGEHAAWLAGTLGIPGSMRVSDNFHPYTAAGAYVLGKNWATGVPVVEYLRGLYTAPAGGGSGVWGSITGTITDQTDLQTEFATKLSHITTLGITGTNLLATYYGDLTAVTAGFQCDALDDYGVVYAGYCADTSTIWQEYLKSRSTDGNTNAAVSADDELGRFNFRGDDGSTFTEGGRMTVEVDGAVSGGVVPGRWTLFTASSTGMMTERLRVNSAGVLGFSNVDTAPSGANPAGGGQLFVEAGALKWRGSSGTVTTLGAA